MNEFPDQKRWIRTDCGLFPIDTITGIRVREYHDDGKDQWGVIADRGVSLHLIYLATGLESREAAYDKAVQILRKLGHMVVEVE